MNKLEFTHLKSCLHEIKTNHEQQQINNNNNYIRQPNNKDKTITPSKQSCTYPITIVPPVACPTYQTDGLSNTRFPFRSVDAVSFRVDISIQSAGLVRILLSRSANMPDPVYTICESITCLLHCSVNL